MKNFSSISFVIPVYNEEETLLDIMEKIEKVDLGLEKEIILIDDGSKDRTKSIIEGFPEKYKKIFHEKNKGKGAAIRSGIGVASGDLIIIHDADLEYDPEDIKKMLVPLLDGQADVVYGSRFLSSGTRRAVFFWHMIGNKLLTLLTNMVSNITLTDMETCYKLFKGELIKSIVLEENRFGFEPEVTIKLSRMNCRIYEVGISYYGRGYAQRKKINWKDGLSAMRCIFKYGIYRLFFDSEAFLEKYLRRYRIKRILPYIRNGKIVCDVGCGRHAAFLRSISTVAKKCIGIDKKASTISYSNIEIKNFELDDKIPLEDESIDVVTLLAVLEHLDNEKEILSEIKRILKRDGRLLITVPTERAKFILEFLAFRLRVVSREELMDHRRYYSHDKLDKLLAGVGFNCSVMEKFELGHNLFCCAGKSVVE